MFLAPDQIAYRYYELFNQRRLDLTERLIHSEALFHYPELNQRLVGPAGHRALSQLWLTAFPDLQLEMQTMRIDDDRMVVLQSVARGTHRGPLRLGSVELAPTKTRFEMPFQHTFEIHDGKIANIILNLDVEELVRKLAAGSERELKKGKSRA